MEYARNSHMCGNDCEDSASGLEARVRRLLSTLGFDKHKVWGRYLDDRIFPEMTCLGLVMAHGSYYWGFRTDFFS